QAEFGILFRIVTGVHTCALPIFSLKSASSKASLSYSTVSCSSAKFTFACSTPSILETPFSTRLAQALQVIPLTCILLSFFAIPLIPPEKRSMKEETIKLLLSSHSLFCFIKTLFNPLHHSLDLQLLLLLYLIHPPLLILRLPARYLNQHIQM